MTQGQFELLRDWSGRTSKSLSRTDADAVVVVTTTIPETPAITTASTNTTTAIVLIKERLVKCPTTRALVADL